VVSRRRRSAGDGGRSSTAVGLLKNWKSSPKRDGGRRSTLPNAPAARPRAPYRTPGVHVACRALRRALAINTCSRARAAAFPHGMRVVALGRCPFGVWAPANQSVQGGEARTGTKASLGVREVCVAGSVRVRVTPNPNRCACGAVPLRGGEDSRRIAY